MTTQTIQVPGGITLQGQGISDDPLQGGYSNGSTYIGICADSVPAIELAGHAASLRDLAVVDLSPRANTCSAGGSSGGVKIHAESSNGRESILLSNVLIIYFTEGTALTLLATNGGGIAYGNFQNVRIRHAKYGILLEADSTSFVK